MKASTWGLVIGLVLGAVWAFDGFAGALLTAFVATIGFTVGKVVQGELDLAQVAALLRREK
jgi:hypothetical protein